MPLRFQDTTTTAARRPDAELRAILERAMPEAAARTRCECEGCAAIRARAFRCACCGYDGEPSVYPCDCAAQKATDLAGMREVVAAAWREGRRTTGAGGIPITAYAAMISTTERERAESCRPEEDRRQCCHGYPECPVCAGGEGRWTDDANRLHAWRIVRELRAALAARGLV